LNKEKQKVLVILLTYKRLERLEKTLNSFLEQTYKDFHVHVSHGDYDTKKHFLKIVNKYEKQIKLSYSIDGNSLYGFRRFTIAKNFVKNGEADIILFLDDDVEILNTHIEECLSQYEPKSYKSAWAFRFTLKPINYSKKERIFEKNVKVDYCGTGISIIDGTFFLNDDFFVKDETQNNYKMEDIWLSFFVKKIGWNLKSLKVDFEMFGNDEVALWKKVWDKKQDYSQHLLKIG
jgi:glycosyltransferase involved in cell wall biosynthesis